MDERITTKRNRTVLFLSAYFRPEITADTHLDDDLVRKLIDAGYKVIVLCPIPTRGITEEIRKKYHGIRLEKLEDGMLEIHRFWAPVERKNAFLRAIRYFINAYNQYRLACKFSDVDAIYCISTPPTQGMLSAFVRKKYLRKYKKNVGNIYYLEDIFPDTLVAAGLARKDSVLWKIGRKIENYTYKNVSQIVTISEGCVNNLAAKGVQKQSIEIINNWIDLSNVSYVPRDKNTLFREYNLDHDGFYLVYAGNLGKAQNIDLILDTAKHFERNNDMKFIIFGSGGEEERVKARIDTEKITNVKILPLQPTERISEVYSLGDADIVICKKGFGGSALPSKTWSIMATERPIIASFDANGDLCKLINETDSGVCADADNLDELIDAVKTVYMADESRRKLMGKNGREYAMKNRDMNACTDQFLSIFERFTAEC